MIDESHATVPQVRAMYNGDRARKESLIILSNALISECIYLTFIPIFLKYDVKSSAIFFVSVVTKTLSPFSVLSFIWAIEYFKQNKKLIEAQRIEERTMLLNDVIYLFRHL